MKANVIGLDIAKNILHLYSIGENDKPVKKKLKRAELLVFFANYPVSLIGIEACGSSHHWARELIKLGHEVILLNARYVKNFVIGNKNDFNDAAGIYDAVTRPNKRTVTIKTIEQQDIQLVHTIRNGLIGKRTALANQTRGLLSERGIVIPKSINQLRKQMPLILEDAKNGLTPLSREMFREHYERLVILDAEIKDQDQRVSRLCQDNELSKRFTDVRGVGSLVATAVLFDIGTGKGYEKGSDYAANLGVVPRQHSSGDKQVYLGISKRGNRYIRTLLIHGARSVISHCGTKQDKLSLWLKALVERRGFNRAAVALANKNARILWAMTTQGTEYDETKV